MVKGLKITYLSERSCQNWKLESSAIFQGSISCTVYTWGIPGLHVWISSADTKPKPPHKFRNNNTLLEALFIPWFRRASFEQSGSLSYELRCIRSYSPLRESVHSSWSSCKFSLARNMHFMLPLMSKGTWMVRTSVWMSQSMPLNIWCRASDARTQQSELTQSSELLLTPQNLWRAKQWEAVGKTGSFAISDVSIFSGMSHAVLTCHKSNFFNCSYVTKNCRY